MTSDGVIIELKHKPDENNRNGKTYTDASTGSRKITVKRFEEPQGSNFYKYTYENENKNDSHGGNFILKAIWDDSGKHIEIPLPDDKKIDGDKLEQTLDELNCYSNNAVTINLTMSNSQNHIDGGQDCCSEHKNEKRVSVKEVEIEGGKQKTKYTKYSISNGKVAGITSYKDDASNDEKNRKRDKSVTCWFQKPSSTGNNDNKQWENVSSQLQGINKDKIENEQLTCSQRTDLAKVLKLGRNNLQECTQETAGLEQSERLLRTDEDAEEQRPKHKATEERKEEAETGEEEKKENEKGSPERQVANGPYGPRGAGGPPSPPGDKGDDGEPSVPGKHGDSAKELDSGTTSLPSRDTGPKDALPTLGNTTETFTPGYPATYYSNS
ncbi:hypothetical protein BEWA_000880 [Theileria equi strain WA]|uniref:Uncharacterized protein n=1 Tax=Theileria equi strain WA TaxID=1537102 RepID=L0AZI6_THEEQ|nr:hypothetical protein BEWA_000880 [Theileria equi strain WA]AFZ80683.1 hypothetical protein BEWA_000880 [Theileria equi strain WA]|eukprot:XP_004830349.1 hypothetical protein BEWA_000880 [Theileria equi strain WA]